MCSQQSDSLADEKFGRCLFLFLVLSVLVSPALYAQLSTASVTGIVRDPTGGVIVGANGILKNVDTGVERTTVTNSAGNYLFLNLNPGRYTLEMRGPGFKSSKVSEFTLAVSQAAIFDVTLEVGGLEQTVTVGATVAEIESSTAQLGSVVAEKQVVDLPLNGRNFTQLLHWLLALRLSAYLKIRVASAFPPRKGVNSFFLRSTVRPAAPTSSCWTASQTKMIC